MSSLYNDPKFGRGQILGITQTMYEAVNGDGSTVMGVKKHFRDENPNTGVLNSNREVSCIAVKNNTGGVLYAGEVAQLKAGALLTEVDAKATTSSIMMGVVDEYIPASGVPDGEVFWLVVGGPSTVKKTSSSVAAGATYGLSGTAGSAAAQSTNPLLGVALATSATTTGRILVNTLAGN